ncbi:MAG: oligosaccharide flippase family protein [Bacteroidia bacterium]|nr:oligosaccharide flippase family protein [Bacteroidia bacterium]
MSVLKKLASQTAIYGLSSIIGRFLNFLLVPLYTRVLLPEEYGVVSVFLGLAAFFKILLVYGMETAFFNFTRTDHPDKSKVYSTALTAVVFTTIFFTVFGLIFADTGAAAVGFSGMGNYVTCCVIFLSLDALTALPFSLLRKQERPLRFATINMVNITVNIAVNLFYFLLCPWLLAKGYNLNGIYDSSKVILYVFVSYVAASAVTFILLLPELADIRNGFNSNLLKKMLKYAYPLIFVGLAGVVNETFDRVLLKKYLPSEFAEYDIGIYSAFYKLSIVMTLFVQAFRFAAEPFFFSKSVESDAKPVYANVMTFFVYVCSGIFLITMLWVNELADLLFGEKYINDPRGMKIVPILLMANLCLGVYYSLSIWYKLSNKNHIGAFMAIGGAILTVIINVFGIPEYGFMASAWATLIVYGCMMVAGYLIGKRFYPVPYRVGLILLTIAVSVCLWQFYEMITPDFGVIANYSIRVLAVLIYLSFVLFCERKALSRALKASSDW